MLPSTPPSSFYAPLHSRRLLYPHEEAASPPSTAAAAEGHAESRLDTHLIMILTVLLCAVICALALNSIIRCALRCSNRVAFESGANSSRQTNTGVKRSVLKASPTLSYTSGLKLLPGFDSKCAICLSEFAHGERVRVLPRCNHGFHVRCIDKWLASHSSCPTCRQCLLEACQKIVGCTRDCRSGQPTALQPVIVPLAPEDLIINYRV